jgi:c-di-GMP-binding flagellar brake protein YcgR
VVTPNGDTTRAQRRAHFRLILDGEVLFALVESEDGHEPFTAHLVDVSEAGMRVRVSPAEAEPFLVGAEVTGSFSIRQDRFDLKGTVLRTLPSERSNHDAAVDVIVLLELTPTQERDLRRALLAEQVQRRRLSRD